MAKYNGMGWHNQSIRHSNARKYGKAGGKYSGRVYLEHKGKNVDGSKNYHYTLIPREDKIDFLMKSGLHKREQLESMDERTLNDFFTAGLEATGFKMNYGRTGASKYMTDVSGLKGMTAYQVENEDGLIFWTLIDPNSIKENDDDLSERIIKTKKMSGELFNSLNNTDKEFILKEYKEMKRKKHR